MLLIYKKHLFQLFIILFLISCSTSPIEEEFFQTNENLIFDINSQVTKNLEEIFYENISYGELNQQVFDIYLPENRSQNYTKVIILIHGGSWVSGDKQEMEDLKNRILTINPNYAIVNMNYTLANNATYAFPNQFLEIDELINVLTEKSTEYQIAPEFALIGESAGGHLALMYDYTYDFQNRVKLVCTLGAPTDFRHPMFQDRPNFEAEFDLLVDEAAYLPSCNLIRKLSPAKQVSYNSSPTLIFHGRNDGLVPLANAKKLRRKLQNHGIRKRLFVFNAGHSNWEEAIMDVVEFRLKRFLQRNFPI